MPIDVRVEGFEKLAQESGRWRTSRKRFAEGLKKEADIFGLDAVARAKKDYLSGPRPSKLGVRTGRLRSSIAREVTARGQEVEIQVGTNVRYAAAHEMGLHQTINVPAFTRVTTKVFGQNVAATISHVSAHSRQANIEARPFLRPAIEDAMPKFDQGIEMLLEEIAIGGFGNVVSFAQ